MNLTVYAPDIPAEMREKESKGRAVKRMALEALEQGLNPVSLPQAGLIRLSIALTDQEYQDFSPYEKPGRLIGEYCYARLLFLRKKQAEKAVTDDRKEQQQYYHSIILPFTTGKIVVAEGGTGLGKSRVLAWLARDQIQAGKAPVCIAVPTIAVMLHMLSEWQFIDAGGIQVSILLGRSQFIDLDRIVAVLTDPEFDMDEASMDKLYEWLDDDCPALKETGNDKLTSIVPDIGYLYSDLLYLAPEMAAVSGLRLTADRDQEPDTSADKIYQELFSALEDADVIICSQAMLAMDMKTRKITDNKRGLLPDFHSLLVDEAHNFEKTVASASSVNTSIITLRAALRATTQGSKVNRARAIRVCNTVLHRGQRLPQDNYFLRPADRKGTPSSVVEVLNSLEELKQVVRALFPKKKYLGTKTKDRPAKIIQTELTNLYKITGRKQPVLISLSPVKKYLSVTTGPSTVKYLFEDLWARIPGGCVLASATLTLPDKYNQPCADYILRLLNIPPARCHIINPVTPAWIRSPIRLHIPVEDEMEALVPPRETVGESKQGGNGPYEQWLTVLAAKITAVGQAARGGTLVLLTSYALLDRISKELPSDIQARAIYQDGKTAFGALREQFIQKAAVGKRPVWFAMGAAWEGMDLSGKPLGIVAEQDNILSDLIISRIPFGLNASLAAHMRNLSFKDKNGGYRSFPVSGRNEAAFLFRQGIGRMVRRKNVPKKNLWVFDARIWQRSYKFYGVFQRILAAYQKGGDKKV